jgi:hypothetical protein
MTGPIVWRGFHFRWDLTSHRLPLLGSRVDDDGPEFSLRIGSWPSDRAHVMTRSCRLGEPARIVARGVVDLQVSSIIGRPGAAEAEVELPTVDGCDVAFVLDGFQLEARVNPAGWHVGGLGLAAVTEDSGRRAVRAELRPAESPHPGIFGLGDWSWDQPCVHDVSVRWAAIAVPRGSARIASGDTSVASALGTTIVDWAPALVPAGPGDACLLTGFNLRVDAPAALRRRSGYLRNLNGRYIRELGVGIEGGRPAIHLSNAPRFIIRLGAVLALYVLAAVSVATMVVATQWALAIVVLVGLGLASWAWPRIWFQAPAVPWALEVEVSCTILEGVGAEPLDARWAHTGQTSRPPAA